MNAVLPGAETRALTLASASVRPLKIALVSLHGHPLVHEEGVYLRHLSCALHLLGHQVEVICGPPWPILDHGVRLTRLTSALPGIDGPQHRPLHSRLAWWRRSTLHGARWLEFNYALMRYVRSRETPFDIIHDNHSLFLGPGMLPRLGCPVVSTIHRPSHRAWLPPRSDTPPALKRFLLQAPLRLLQRRALNQLQGIVVVSESARQEITTHMGVNPQVVHLPGHGVDIDRLRPRPELARVPGRIMLKLDEGVSAEEFQTFLQSLASVKAVCPSAHAVALTQNTARDWETMARTQNLADSIEFRRAVPVEHIADEYARAALAVCLSARTTFATDVAEAMACGVPVVSTDASATREILAGAGLLYPGAQTRALTDAILRMLTDPAFNQQCRLQGRQRAEDRLSWKLVAFQLTHFYQNYTRSVPRQFA